jgi:Zn-dependent protease with chaperone function
VLESRWRAALAMLVAVAAGTWATAVWGLPMLAERVARSLPPSVHVAIGAQALEALDGSLFAPSTMPARRQARLRARFERLVGEAPLEPDVTLHFRASPVGANAFALPSGDVIVTDELVALAEHDDEVMAVLAHELGHVVHHHGLRQLLQSSVATLVVVALVGDAGAVTSIAAGLPGLLLNAGYSRRFEREADAFALERLRTRGVDPARFADVLERLEKKAGVWPAALSYLSTHPATADRVVPFRAGR